MGQVCESLDRRHDDGILKLPWGEGCGWYDVNKTYWKDHAEDEYMCWAGASSNILHWWIDRNKEYVAAYDARYGNEPEFEKYPRPSADFSPASKSAIFQLFIDTFQNRGAGEGVKLVHHRTQCQYVWHRQSDHAGLPGLFRQGV